MFLARRSPLCPLLPQLGLPELQLELAQFFLHLQFLLQAIPFLFTGGRDYALNIVILGFLLEEAVAKGARAARDFMNLLGQQLRTCAQLWPEGALGNIGRRERVPARGSLVILG